MLMGRKRAGRVLRQDRAVASLVLSRPSCLSEACAPPLQKGWDQGEMERLGVLWSILWNFQADPSGRSRPFACTFQKHAGGNAGMPLCGLSKAKARSLRVAVVTT